MQTLQQGSKLQNSVCTALAAASSVLRTPMACCIHRSSSRSRTTAARVLRSPTHLHCANFTGGAVPTVQDLTLDALTPHNSIDGSTTYSSAPAECITGFQQHLCLSHTGAHPVATATAVSGSRVEVIAAAAALNSNENTAEVPHVPNLAATAGSIPGAPLAVQSAVQAVQVTAAAATAALSAKPVVSCVHNPVVDPDASNPHYNKSGLNGLRQGSTSGLETGSFTVAAAMPVRYTVQEVPGLLSTDSKALLRGVVPGSFPFALGPEPVVTAGLRRLVIIDETVEQIYGQQLRQYFAHHGVEYQLLALPTCEVNKDFKLVECIAQAMEDFKINRRQDPIIAIGGGVCLDVAGLAANLYRRHTGIIKVPTTVMAVVDASIGIKTAVNFHEKKNKLGTYCPPLGVFYDTSLLMTLDQRHISNGAAEILKMACIKDQELFELMDSHAEDVIASKFQGAAAASIIRRSIQGMLEELEYNLWEAILCRLVDYGHTVSPELEMAALRSPEMLLHGEAVAIDMALSTELAFGRGLLTGKQRSRVLNLMIKLKLPLWHDACSTQLLIKGLEDSTRARDGLQRVPLMRGIGAATFVNDITSTEMAAAANSLLHFAAANGYPAAVAAVQSVRGDNLGLAIGNIGQGSSKNNIVPLAPAGVKLAANSIATAAAAAAQAVEVGVTKRSGTVDAQ